MFDDFWALAAGAVWLLVMYVAIVIVLVGAHGGEWDENE